MNVSMGHGSSSTLLRTLNLLVLERQLRLHSHFPQWSLMASRQFAASNHLDFRDEVVRAAGALGLNFHQSITEFETAKVKRRSLYYIYLIIHAQS